MCGITGIINLNKTPVDKALLKKMNDIIDYRGPDDEGFYYDDSYGLGFGHRRLSIIDLSPLGHQPMSSENEDLWITYNGEVYNYIELMEELKSKGYKFKSKSDTEVILNAYKEWGEDCVKKFNGMWAFAIWDKNNSKLFCSRDRMGIKPFYYYINNNVFLFASEIKQLVLHPEYSFEPDKQMIYDFLVYGNKNHSEYTFYKNIKQLQGGNSLTLNLNQSEKYLKITSYWDIDLNYDAKKMSNEDYEKLFFEKFYDSVKLRLRSDVPVGSCLSGGLDSSSIVCLVDKLLNESGESTTQKTFSSCFEDKKYDERKFINLVEKKTNVLSKHVFPHYENLTEQLENLIWHQDEPINTLSMLAQREVFKAAREENVIVMLDGQGGDELLAGYHVYLWANQINLAKKLKFIQLFKEIKSCHNLLNYSYKRIFISLYKNALNGKKTKSQSLFWLKDEYNNSYYQSSIAQKIQNTTYSNNNLKNYLYKSLRYTNMPNLLHFEDRNSMTSSIESRVPFLDYKLVEYCFSLPNKQKINNSITKTILRNSLKSLLPEEICNRHDKMGFVTPDNKWLKGPLKDFYLNILNSDEIKELNMFNIEELINNFKLYCNNSAKQNPPFWRIISLVIWYKMAKSY